MVSPILLRIKIKASGHSSDKMEEEQAVRTDGAVSSNRWSFSPIYAMVDRVAKVHGEHTPWPAWMQRVGLDLPDEDFDYDEFAAREFGRAPHRWLGVKWYWWVLGGITVVAVLAWALGI